MIASKKCIYVGGLPDSVDKDALQNIFAAFGDIIELQMPIEVLTGKHKGYAFVEFKENEDADDAIDNMHESEIYGKTIRVTPAKGRTTEGEMISSSRAVWESDEWLKQFAGKTLIQNESNDGVVSRDNFPTEKETIFMDVSIDGQYTGRMVFELRNDVVPKTAFNFRSLCEQTRGNGYKQCGFHRVIPGFMAQSGDFINHNGTGGKSVFGEKFQDENFLLKHTNVGDLSMANSGPNTNGSQFFITFKKTDWLDDKHVVFGHLKSGVETLKKIEAVGTQKGKPLKRVIIEDCGQLL